MLALKNNNSINIYLLNDAGLLHCETGPALKDEYGEYYYINGKLHREDGPAEIFYDGDMFWYRNGVLHRIDGPAKVYNNLNDIHFVTEIWYINGKRLTEECIELLKKYNAMSTNELLYYINDEFVQDIIKLRTKF